MVVVVVGGGGWLIGRCQELWIKRNRVVFVVAVGIVPVVMVVIGCLHNTSKHTNHNYPRNHARAPKSCRVEPNRSITKHHNKVHSTVVTFGAEVTISNNQ